MAYKTKRSKVVKCDLHDLRPRRHGRRHLRGQSRSRQTWLGDDGRQPERGACVNALFPKAHIAWRDPGEGLPIDWLGFDINVPDVIAATATKFPHDSKSKYYSQNVAQKTR